MASGEYFGCLILMISLFEFDLVANLQSNTDFSSPYAHILSLDEQLRRGTNLYHTIQGAWLSSPCHPRSAYG